MSHHNIHEPGDIMQAQYSVPFCVALAVFRDPDDPKSFASNALDDPAIRAVCRNVELRAQGGHSPFGTTHHRATQGRAPVYARWRIVQRHAQRPVNPCGIAHASLCC